MVQNSNVEPHFSPPTSGIQAPLMASTVLYIMCREKGEGDVVVEAGQQSP